jgi:S-adenosylmethionine:tRNA ribosyltransferase-isomerase
LKRLKTKTKKSNAIDPSLKSSYDYALPEHLIATAPITPRDHARLLVYDRNTDTITHTRFNALFTFLPQACSILLNDTKVIKARLLGQKSSGGKIEVLLNSPLHEGQYKVYIRGKVTVGSRLFFAKGLEAHVISLCEDGTRIVRFLQDDVPLHVTELYRLLESIGHIPLPPYIKREDTLQDAHDYQTVFAKTQGAVAAPTASLHFSETMLETMLQQFSCAYLTLHVGAGTFKPVDAEHISDHVMHEERFFIPQKAQALIDNPAPLLAVGTTVTRTVEYYARTKQTEGNCDLFLHPHNPPCRVSHLLTNFHLPKSTLIMLVAGFIGLGKTLELYKEAVKNEYRFFSYGDAMLIL